jgi:hypothetical protein
MQWSNLKIRRGSKVMTEKQRFFFDILICFCYHGYISSSDRWKLLNSRYVRVHEYFDRVVFSVYQQLLYESCIDTPKLPLTDHPKWQDRVKHR